MVEEFELSEWYDKLLPQWRGVCYSDFDDEVMCQIHCIINRKWQLSQNTSKRLGITFAVDGLSHWALIEPDAEFLHKYVKLVINDTYLKEALWRYTLHVQTAHQAIEGLRVHLTGLKLRS